MRSSSTRSSGRCGRPRSTRSTDGVVPYTSSHLDGVASEKIVRSDHGVQKDPEAIREVRRILREHVGVMPTVPRSSRKPELQSDAAPAVKLEMPVPSGKVLVRCPGTRQVDRRLRSDRARQPGNRRIRILSEADRCPTRLLTVWSRLP